MEPSELSIKKALVSGLLIWAFLVVLYLLYSPGIAPGFIFDDFENLSLLGTLGTIDNWSEVANYILTGPSRRPLSMASFLINDNAWPSAAESFKYTNVVLHLGVTALLVWLVYLLVKIRGYEGLAAISISIGAAAFWALHPLHVSTVLYPVQRMAIMSAFFVLAGLVMYVIGRRLISKPETNARGYILMFIAIGVFTPMAALSKENGALLPILAIVLELTLLNNLEDSKGNTKRLYASWAMLFGIPIMVLVTYFVINWEAKIVTQYITRRDFTMAERLMTEGRIIWDYIGKLFLPRMQSSGLYYDNYPFSTGLLTPAQTLPAILGLAGIVGLALKFRKYVPFISCAVLFFLAGHIVESTFIPLELYFEHRNYLPSALLFLPVAVGIHKLYSLNMKVVGSGIAIIFVLLFGSFTYARASLWGDMDKMALIWVAENPGSLRTQQQASIMWSNRGQFERALKHTNKAIEYHPDKIISYINKMSVLCALNRQMPEEDLNEAVELAASKGVTKYSIKAAEYFIQAKSKVGCNNVKYSGLIEIISSAIESEKIKSAPANIQHLYYLLSRIYFLQGDQDKARESLVSAYHANPASIESGMQIVGTLATYGFYKKALELLDDIEGTNRKNNSFVDLDRDKLIRMNREFSREIERIRENIKNDMQSNQKTES